jgi:hypothetical protein
VTSPKGRLENRFELNVAFLQLGDFIVGHEVANVLPGESHEL